MPGPVPPFRRFLSGFEVDRETGCWNWIGHRYPNGYGVIKAFGRDVSAHRFSYELHKGPIPDGMQILHSCDNKRCVNPDHLRIGTHLENIREAWERGLMRPKPKGTPNPAKGILNPGSKPVRVLGRVFGSMNEAEKALSLGSGTVRFWTMKHPHKAQIISREEYANAQ